jgi:hypothetical protein
MHRNMVVFQILIYFWQILKRKIQHKIIFWNNLPNEEILPQEYQWVGNIQFSVIFVTEISSF